MTRASAKQGTYTMNLPQFDRYLRDKAAEMRSCIAAVEDIHSQYQATFQHELEAWQELFRYCYPQLMLRRKEMPADLQAYLDRVEAEELARLKGQIADLEQQLARLRAEMDKEMAQAHEALRALHAANPELDRREEQLKATIVKLQDEYAQAYEKMEEIQRPSLGWLTNARAIRRLKRLQKTIKKQQAEAMQKLAAVRQEWLTKVEQTSETQSDLRAAWQQAGITSAELQARYDYLVNNLEDLARQEGLQRALQEITETYPVEGELGEKLAEIARRNGIRAAYEKGLAASSETLGLLRGIGSGLEKFGQSVSNVLAQQRRYNLKQIQIPLPHDVGVINQIWAQLEERLRDKSYMAAHPLEFAQIAEQYVTGRLTPEVIERFFEQMGAALNRGTAAWD